MASQPCGRIFGTDTITAGQLAALSPCLRSHISRFGAYVTDELVHQPEAFNPVLKEVDFTRREAA